MGRKTSAAAVEEMDNSFAAGIALNRLQNLEAQLRAKQKSWLEPNTPNGQW